MDSELWGPKLWFFLHTISFEYPDKPTQEIKNAHIDFFRSLKSILPCDVCKNHFSEFLKNNPIEDNLGDKEALIRWVLKCHNNVNTLNNKPEWSYKKLVSTYASIFNDDLYNKMNYKNSSIFLFVLLILFSLIIFIK